VLAWIAVAPLLWLAYGEAPAWQVAGASFFAYLVGAINLYQAYGNVLLRLAPYLPLLAFAFAGCVLFARAVHRRMPVLAALFAFPVAWTVVDYATALFSPNGSYVSWAYSQAFVPILIQTTSIFGMWILTFILAITSTAVAIAARDGKRAIVAVGVTAALLLANCAFGFVHLGASQSASIRVGLLTNDALPFAHTKSQSIAVSRQYASDAAAIARHGVSVVVLPEKTVAIAASWSAAITPYRNLSAKTGSIIVVGFEEHGASAQNVALTFFPDGRIDRYAKQHLITGFEPLIPGHDPGLLENGKAVEICKDMDYPTTVRNDARRGGVSVMFVPAWDFVRDRATHASMAILRGVENGFAVVRPARQGLMTVSDAQGRIVAQAASRSAGPVFITASVSPGPGTTFYARTGDWFAWLCLLVWLALIVAAVTRTHHTEHLPSLTAS
jgi:apolipoprotein N-acyltransferase